MKKQIVVAAMVAGLIAAGTASANRGYGYGGCGQFAKGQGGMVYQQLDQATQDKIAQFRDDNQALRKEIAMKRAEKRALFNSTNPDPAAAAEIAGELFDLRTTLRLKAQAAGVAEYIGRRGMGLNGDYQMGQGKGFRGKGPGRCQGGNRF